MLVINNYTVNAPSVSNGRNQAIQIPNILFILGLPQATPADWLLCIYAGIFLVPERDATTVFAVTEPSTQFA